MTEIFETRNEALGMIVEGLDFLTRSQREVTAKPIVKRGRGRPRKVKPIVKVKPISVRDLAEEIYPIAMKRAEMGTPMTTLEVSNKWLKGGKFHSVLSLELRKMGVFNVFDAEIKSSYLVPGEPIFLKRKYNHKESKRGYTVSYPIHNVADRKFFWEWVKADYKNATLVARAIEAKEDSKVVKPKVKVGVVKNNVKKTRLEKIIDMVRKRNDQ